MHIDLINSDNDENNNGKTDLLYGEQITENIKNKTYTYLANIKDAKSGKIKPFKVVLNNQLKCISSTLDCAMIGPLPAEYLGENK